MKTALYTTLIGFLVCPIGLASGLASSDPSLLSALKSGRFDLFLRYRFEAVEDATPNLAPAYASTLRSALGYRTGAFHNADGYLQVEDVRVVGDDKLYNDGGANGVSQRAVVADPEGFELQQGIFRYSGLPRTVFTVGRQEITHRQAPLHRYIGNVLWRQNWQNYDSLRLLNLSIPHTTLDYAYVWQVNRIFGGHNPRPDAGHFEMDSHLFNLQYAGLRFAKLEAYSYLLDFTTPTSTALSTATLGLRLQGDKPIMGKARLLYVGEYARQLDYGSNPNAISVSYLLAELGVNFTVGGFLQSMAVKFSYERLEGKGGVNAFQTPLGTNHAFQGFADRFLVTPPDGIRDYFATLSFKFAGSTQLIAAYHHFGADQCAYAYGDEVNVVLEQPFGEQLLAGVKYADYRADSNPANLIRNTQSGQAYDLSKFWVYLQYSF
ncbi:MAG: hypothetical protein PHH59_12785 [Methylovulum sp.]|uniref:hypothetical protein n=1 Tax=Methylovulum sp. TaxID=1916980 RepID=UPI002625014D|nr:hypothetical protein [Methylovulum sp.]MDD2724883.1 hypothetical protein [Methylovulum sp.]MDD5124715.1 hypothetical protein [Methylovulum sp.]